MEAFSTGQGKDPARPIAVTGMCLRPSRRYSYPNEWVLRDRTYDGLNPRAQRWEDWVALACKILQRDRELRPNPKGPVS